LVHFVLSWEKREACKKLCQNAAKTPHINWCGVWYSKDNLWGSIKTRLNISVYTLILEATTSVIYNFDARFIGLLEQDVLRLKIAVNNTMLSLVFKSLQYLDCKPADKSNWHPSELIILDKLIEINAQELEWDDEMLSENCRILDSNNVIHIIRVILS
jgi:hypothetical protein